ncbi:MAG: trypsin-like peptidase domain-containing protein [Patescibacteria group bacterium]|nr:trypsin-like peptidase domain-containing protein [Patescibacteria group bacterium]
MPSPLNKTITKVMPAVVSVIISKSLEELEKELPAEMSPVMPFGVPKMDIPEENIDAHGMVQVGGGSGFVVSSNGIILTNKHVIAESNASYTVLTDDGKRYPASVLARDPIDDVAILKIDAEDLPVVTLGDSSKIELGDDVLAIGNALGLFKNTVSRGIISGLSRSIAAKPDPKEPVQELRGLIQTDAAINPGNSGGPLINLDGEVIGINAAIVFGAQNVGFAIPINAAKRDIADVKKFGRVRRPLLGLRYVNIDEMLQQKLNLPTNYGALVAGKPPHTTAVIPNTPASVAGLKEKDIILECNGVKLSMSKTIQDFLEDLNVGDILALKVLRGDKMMSINVTLAERA